MVGPAGGRTMRLFVTVAGGCLLLGGCTTLPNVNYAQLPDSKPSDRVVPYELTDSVIVIGTVDKSTPSVEKPTSGIGSGVGGAGQGQQGSGQNQQGVGQNQQGGGQNVPNGVLQPTRWDLKPVTLTQKPFDNCDGGACEGAVAAVAVPISFRQQIYSIEGRNRFFVHTILTPTYQEKSLRLKSLSVDILDQRKEALDTAAAVWGGVGKVSRMEGAGASYGVAAQPKSPKLTVPIAIKLQDIKQKITPDGLINGGAAAVPLAAKGEVNDGWYYTAEWIGPDAKPAALGFHPIADIRQFHGSVVTSMCRHMLITLTDGKNNVAMEVIVADPDFIQAVPLPAKGVVTFNELCGADVSGPTALPTASASLVSEFFAQFSPKK